MRGPGRTLSEGQSLGHGRDAQGRRARVHRGPGDVGRAVPVPVRLDHGPELRRAEHAPQPRDVPAQRAEVDRDLRARHAARAAAPRRRRSLRGPSACSTDHRRVRVRRRRRCRRQAGVHALGEERADDPGQDVARPRRRQRRPAGCRRSAPPRVRRRASRSPSAGRRSRTVSTAWSRACRRCASTHARLDAEQAGELAGVRREHRRRRPRERLQPEQRVGVDDRRQVGLLRAAGARAPSARRPARGPARSRARRRGTRRRRRRRAAASPPRARASRGSESTRRERRSRRSPASARNAAREASAAAPVIPREPPTTRTEPARVLVVARRAARDELEDVDARDLLRLRLERLQTDVGHFDVVAAEELAGPDLMPDLLAVERDRARRLDRGSGHLAGRRVHPRGQVDRHDLGIRRVDRARSARPRPARGSPEKPVPNSASTITSGSPRSVSPAFASTIRHLAPACSRYRAATRPSPPLTRRRRRR